MYLNIRITWPAWSWFNSTARIILSIFSHLGYDFITDIEYESRIKWWVNYFDVFISDDSSKFLTKKIDIVIAFNRESLEKQLSSLKPGSTIIVNKKYLEKLKQKNIFNTWILSLNEKFNILSPEINDKYDNIYLLWVFAKYLKIPFSVLEEKIQEVFEKKWEVVVKLNKEVVKNIFDNFEIKEFFKENLQTIGQKKEFSYWNKAIVDGATNCWLEFYRAYPMTPASSILTEIIKQKKVKYIQNEDEIAVVMSTLWASFTWARAMCWTSWWGFALMSESISFAAQAEIPLTIVLSQRAWPSTWTPTYHESGDLNFALNPSFWDFEHVVMCPSSLEESYYFWWLALNIADKYQTQVILLTDKQASSFNWTVWELESPKIDRGKILEKPNSDYKRYDLSSEYWISPRVKVWTFNWDFIASSYEHDEYGATTEDPQIKKLMTEKRWKKLKNFFDREWIYGYEIINKNAKKMIILISYTSYTAKEFIKRNSDFWLIIVKFLKPLDKRLRDELIWKEEVIFIENNYSWQLEKYITNELWLKYIDWLKISNLRKYDLYPFYIEDFESLKNK